MSIARRELNCRRISFLVKTKEENTGKKLTYQNRRKFTFTHPKTVQFVPDFYEDKTHIKDKAEGDRQRLIEFLII